MYGSYSSPNRLPSDGCETDFCQFLRSAEGRVRRLAAALGMTRHPAGAVIRLARVQHFIALQGAGHASLRHGGAAVTEARLMGGRTAPWAWAFRRGDRVCEGHQDCSGQKTATAHKRGRWRFRQHQRNAGRVKRHEAERMPLRSARPATVRFAAAPTRVPLPLAGAQSGDHHGGGTAHSPPRWRAMLLISGISAATGDIVHEADSTAEPRWPAPPFWRRRPSPATPRQDQEYLPFPLRRPARTSR